MSPGNDRPPAWQGEGSEVEQLGGGYDVPTVTPTPDSGHRHTGITKAIHRPEPFWLTRLNNAVGRGRVA